MSSNRAFKRQVRAIMELNQLTYLEAYNILNPNPAKVTVEYVVGQVSSGKTYSLKLRAAAYLRQGLRVLYVTPHDPEAKNLIKYCIQSGVTSSQLENLTVRIQDSPSKPSGALEGHITNNNVVVVDEVFRHPEHVGAIVAEVMSASCDVTRRIVLSIHSTVRNHELYNHSYKDVTKNYDINHYSTLVTGTTCPSTGAFKSIEQPLYL